MSMTTEHNKADGASSVVVWLSGLALLVLSGVWLSTGNIVRPELDNEGWGRNLFVAGVMLSGAIYLLAVWGVKRRPVAISGVFVLGLAMRLVLLAYTPAHVIEDDFYRYLWDGAVVAHGLNPYRYSPEQALAAAAGEPGTDARLAAIAASGQSNLTYINNRPLTTIYPPLAQAGFALAYLLKPFSVTALRVLYLMIDVLVFGLLLVLLRRLLLPSAWALIYWWNPLVLESFYIEAHMDLMALPFVLLALLATVRSRPILAGAAVALGAAVKLWPAVLLPVILWKWRGQRRSMIAAATACVIVAGLLLAPMILTQAAAPAGVWTYAGRWESNAGLYPLQEAGWSLFLPRVQARFIARLATAGLLILWTALVLRRMRQTPTTLAKASLLVVAGMFLLSPTQFPWYYTWVLLLLVFQPIPALLAYTPLLPLYSHASTHSWVVWLEHSPIWLLLAWEARKYWRKWVPIDAPPFREHSASEANLGSTRVAVIIPALNEELSIGRVVAAIPSFVSQVIVVDNGSTDKTADVARAAGAQVVSEPRRGYGAACLAGIEALEKPDIVVFLDADFSDDPSEMERMIAPIRQGRADLVIGSRTSGNCERGALTLPQQFGNWLACVLIRLLWRVRYTDLGPFRAIRYSALRALEMNDKGYGWTIQMQVRAARLGLRFEEVPVSYRRRIGFSKVSGTLRGIFGAGFKILARIVSEKFWYPKRVETQERLIVFARFPVPGETKTRMIGHLGAMGAAELQDAMTRHTLERVREFAHERGAQTEIRFTGGDAVKMATRYGNEWNYAQQGEGDLGRRLHCSIFEAFTAGANRVVVIGTDCPGISPSVLASAFDWLAEQDLVIGPAADGGFYLLGLRGPCVQLLDDIPWGTGEVFSRTLCAAKHLGLSSKVLSPLRDVDRPDDLTEWEKHGGKLWPGFA